jgi:2-deoxy-D-gluconate 3-dehydrogenase
MSILNSFDLSGKIALVMGCKRGISKSMAISLAEAGADIIGVSATLELENSEIEKEIAALSRKFYAYQCDFKDRTTLCGFKSIMLWIFC